ncbi:MAG: PadR family transcriptional regulator [Thermoanaerobaculia bacterium]
MSLEHVLLALLSDEPASGYDLKKRVDRELDPLWRAELSQIYPSLARLRRAGFAEMKVLGPGLGPASRRYRVTSRGRRELERWWKEPLRPPDLRDESLLRVLAAEAAGGRAFAEALRAYDRALSDEMARLRKKSADTVIAEAVRQAALSRLEAARRWTRAKAPGPTFS